MGNIFMIGDTHFGHTKLLTLEPLRAAFASSIEEHDEKIIENWNKMVRTKDVVYHLGDVCFGNFKPLKRLKGYKKLILGNHDKETQLGAHFDRMFGAVKFSNEFMLTHIPIHPGQLEYRFKYNIHGHLHSSNVKIATKDGCSEIDDYRYINVSCEQIGFMPIAWEDLKKKL